MKQDLSRLSIHQLRHKYLGRDRPVSRQVLNILSQDQRRGAQKLYQTLYRREAARRKERRRIRKLLEFERRLWESGLRYLAGVDEAGVGPLAGPVVAAAVAFTPQPYIAGLDDSKRLNSRQRAKLETLIRQQAHCIGIGTADVVEIERLNIYWASILAMKRAVQALDRAPEYLLVDARKIPDLSIPQQVTTGGDAVHFSVAAASVIAKNHRDQIMLALDQQFPHYGFASHKGYSTKRHREAIRKCGLCPAHRRSYESVQELAGNWSTEFNRLRELLRNCSSPSALAPFEQHLEAGRSHLSPYQYRKLKHLYSQKVSQLANHPRLPFPK